jgi:mono/diheme cytochrome c family protein
MRDVATRLRFCTATVAFAAALVAPLALAQPADCPQPRFTGQAPADYYTRTSPVAPTDEVLKAAQTLFLGTKRQASCAVCHGEKGDGKGLLSAQYDPPPRNFACAKTVNGVPDGQLFWIIRFGSPGTAMPPHSKLSDDQIWQLVGYLRQLAK